MGIEEGDDMNYLYAGQTTPVFTPAARIENSNASDYRFGRYPDGSLKLQGAYNWSCGFECGVTWRDVPVVDVDDQGNEVSRETPHD